MVIQKIHFSQTQQILIHKPKIPCFTTLEYPFPTHTTNSLFTNPNYPFSTHTTNEFFKFVKNSKQIEQTQDQLQILFKFNSKIERVRWESEEERKTDPPHPTKKLTHHLWTLPIPPPITHSSSSRSETAGPTCGTQWLWESCQVVVVAVNKGDERWELWPRCIERERDIASGGIDGGDERPWELLS